MRSTAKSRHPVIIATGEKSVDHLDFELPGPIELEWRRQYRSGDARTHGWFGQGWSHPLATELWIDDDVLRYWDEQGREVPLPAVQVGQEHFEAYEQFTLMRPAANHWALRHNQGLTHHFRQRHPAQRCLSLEVVQDRNRRRIWLQFDDNDFGEGFDGQALPPRPRRLVDSAGRTLHLLWTHHQQLQQVVVESGDTRVALASYGYSEPPSAPSERPDLQSHTNPNNHTRTYTWEQHLLVGYTLATGQRFANRYDRLTPAGKVTESLALDDGTGDWFDYNGRTTRVRDRLGRETVYVSNARHDLVAVHDAAGNVTRTDYDDEGRPAGSTDALGRGSSTTFDIRGNLTQMADAAGNATKVEYNALDLPVKLTDAMGGEWLRQYDERGNLIASTDPLGHTTLYVVDALGQVTAIIDALDKRKALQWDEGGNVIAYTDCSGNTTRYAYDALGHLRSGTDALGQETLYRFDPLGQLLQLTLPDGAQHQCTWDGEGHLTRYVDPLGRETTWTYNGAGAPLLRTNPLGHKRRYEYDHGGRLVTLTNENGEATRLGFNLLDRITDEVGFDGRHQRYCFNAAGELTHMIERGGSDFGPGKVTRFERDVLGRITAKHHIGEAQEHAASCQFTYDALGRLTEANNAWSKVKFAYDPLGQLLAETQTLSASIGAKVFEFKHQYDALGNRTQTVLPGGRALNYLFYGSGHLHQINLDGKVVSDFERDALYREVLRSQGQLQSEFAYDRVGRLTGQRVLHNGHAAASSSRGNGLVSPGFPAPSSVRDFSEVQRHLPGVIERHYQYDISGQLVQWLDRHRGLTGYGYDAAGRITRSQIGVLKEWGALGVHAAVPGHTMVHPMAANEQFVWDPASNPLSIESGLPSGGPRGHVAGNRLLVWQDTRYTYDVHGNLTERLQGKRGSAGQTRTLFTWDAAHQLARADVMRGPDRAAIAEEFSYTYDALGRRVAKTDVFGTTHFAWEGDKMVLEQRGGIETAHLYDPDAFVPLAQLHQGVLHHLHTDQLGTPLEASNDAGEITWRVTYRTWGNVVVEEVSEIEQRMRFQGQYFDTETGLHYNRFRYYDHGPGRFISEDPIGAEGGFNLFQYAPNPIEWVDPLGLVFAHVRFPKSKIIKRVTIKMQGSRKADFKEANRIAKLHGCRGKPTQDSEKYVHGDVTWHHATYNKKTNTAVMELVTTADHEAKFPHAGSVSDFEKAHGVEYDTDESKEKAKELNGKCPCSS